MNRVAYEEKARGMTIAEMEHALRDIKATLDGPLCKTKEPDDPYVIKLYDEWDAYVVEVYRRRKV
jgi:hypothetical protein